MSKERELLESCLDEMQYHNLVCPELKIEIKELLAQPEQESKIDFRGLRSNGDSYSPEQIEESLAQPITLKSDEFQWNKAKTICTLNGVRWLVGPEAPEELTWVDANKWCKSVGGELPSREILLHAYLNENTNKEFASDHYWSSTEYDSFGAWNQNFYNGFQFTNGRLSTLPVRAVRAINIGE